MMYVTFEMLCDKTLRHTAM